MLSPCLFNLYAEKCWLDGLQAGIKIGGGNINNFRYEDDTTQMAESEEERKSFLMKVKKESERAGLKLNIKKTKSMTSSPITSANRWEKIGNIGRFYFGGLQSH